MCVEGPRSVCHLLLIMNFSIRGNHLLLIMDYNATDVLIRIYCSYTSCSYSCANPVTVSIHTS
jgi:hypothetical protein